MSRLISLSKFSNPPPKLPSLTLFRSIATISPFQTLSRDQSPIARTSPVEITSPVAITSSISNTSPRFTQSHCDFSASIVKTPSQAAALGFDVSTASPRSKFSPLSSFSVNGAQKSPLQAAALCFGVSTASPRFTQSPRNFSCASIAKSLPQTAFGVSTASPRDYSCASSAKSPPQAAALDFGVSTASPRDFSCASSAKSPPQAAAFDFGVSTVSPGFRQSHCDISNASTAKTRPQAATLTFGVSTVPLRSYINPAQSISLKHLCVHANSSSLQCPNFISARGYYETPSFRGGKVIKPDVSELIKEVDFRCKIEQRQVSEELPEDAAIELTFLQLPAVDNTLVPYFRIHSLLASCVENGKLVHMVDNDIRKTSDWGKIRKNTGEEITNELIAKGISVEEMKKFWFDNGPDHKKFWSERFLKHHKFSMSHCIENYESLIWKFACEYLKDNSERPSLGNYLASKGFFTGSYYNSHEYLAAVDEYFKVQCYTTFKNHGKHPAAREISVLVKGEGMSLEEGVQVQLRDHPHHHLVGQGKFLLANI